MIIQMSYAYEGGNWIKMIDNFHYANHDSWEKMEKTKKISNNTLVSLMNPFRININVFWSRHCQVRGKKTGVVFHNLLGNFDAVCLEQAWDKLNSE